MAGRGGGLTTRALELAYRYLNRRDRTVSEVRQYLVGRGVAEGEIEDAVCELIEQGYLDDVRFARLFVEDKRQLEQWGSERIRRGLRNRGIARDLAEEALGEDGEGSEREQALELLRRRFPAPPHDRRARERALGMLLRRGYPYEVASAALSAHSGGVSAATGDC